MQKEFEMSMMGELKFFLGLQINQAEDAIYIHQTKYVKELLMTTTTKTHYQLLKKFNLKDCKIMSTFMHLTSFLSLNGMDKKVDQTSYKDLKFIITKNQLVDIFTKPFPKDKLVHIKNFLGMTFIIE
ncbi:hypothetical protein CR513_25773, partial [Mucuna pruriens]